MTITAFAPVGAWLGSTPLSQGARAALRASSWLAPADETLHILALTTLFASAAIVNLRLLGVIGKDRAPWLKDVAPSHAPTGANAVMVMVLPPPDALRRLSRGERGTSSGRPLVRIDRLPIDCRVDVAA